MQLVAIGGDLRYAHLIRQARMAGMDAGAIGLENAPVDGVKKATWTDVRHAEHLVLPNPFLKGPVLPHAGEAFGLTELLRHVSAGTTLMLFGPGNVPDAVRVRHPIILLAKDEPLTRALARQTAEGAIHAAQARAAYELNACPVLIVGYGRIAQALHRMLDGYGAQVTVAARRATARDEASSRGAAAIDMPDLPALIGGYRMIFSTPPERVLGESVVALIHPHALVVDLSSPPYGVDLNAAHARGIDAWREPALPGRYCPESAGLAMLNAALDAIKGGPDHVE